MNSIDEQIAYIQASKNELIFEIENNPLVDIDNISIESIMLISIEESLKSLKQLLGGCNFDYSVSTFHKRDYEKILAFNEIDKRTRNILLKRYNNRTKAINRFKSKMS